MNALTSARIYPGAVLLTVLAMAMTAAAGLQPCHCAHAEWPAAPATGSPLSAGSDCPAGYIPPGTGCCGAMEGGCCEEHEPCCDAECDHHGRPSAETRSVLEDRRPDGGRQLARRCSAGIIAAADYGRDSHRRWNGTELRGVLPHISTTILLI